MIRGKESEATMNIVISIVEARKKFLQLVKEVETGKASYIFTRNRRPVVVLVSYEDYLKIHAINTQEAFAKFDSTWKELGKQNAHIPEEELEADLEAVTKVLRERRRNETGGY